jgi:hypothetical protein
MSYLDELNARNRAELVEIAEDYGIAVGRKSKKQLSEEIFRFETGIADEEVEIKKVEPKVKPVEDPSDFQLVKFTGTNANFQVGDFTFTRKNPFMAVPSRVASHVYRTWPQKFRPANPDEVREFYS